MIQQKYTMKFTSDRSAGQAACYGQMYTIKAGDTLYMIANQYGMPLNVLLAANPQITNPDVIYPGQVICIPSSFPSSCSGQLYNVRSGDTLFSISQRYGVPLNTLIAANPQIFDPNVLYPGMIICIPMM